MTNRLKTFILTAVAASLLLNSACNHGKSGSRRTEIADSLINTAKQADDYERMLALTDSLEQTGDLNEVKANCHRVRAYYIKGDDTHMELYARKAIDGDIHRDRNTYEAYTQVVGLLADVLLLKGDEEGALKVALPVMNAWKQSPDDYPATRDSRSRLFPLVAQCQIRLGNLKEGEHNFLFAYRDMMHEAETDTTGWALYLALQVTDVATSTYKNCMQNEKTEQWLGYMEPLIARWACSPDGREHPDDVDEQWGRYWASRMQILNRQGKTADAEAAFRQFRTTHFANSVSGHLRTAAYLMATEHYQEAADLTEWVDSLVSMRNMIMTLDNINAYLTYKFNANYMAGRYAKALEAGRQIANSLESAINTQKKDAAAELATLYETQDKERTIALQQTRLSQQRLTGAIAALTLITLFFVLYSLYRRKAQRRLQTAHEQLKAAYDQLEETTTQKERIESELRIAREIQMSMVPHDFPERDGLDLYASMTPAKAVGGDLYDYMMDGGKLYFCLGDVSGKGVPASLFMAQAIRLFRAMAKRHYMPEEVATRINDELTENNDNGMFVTMFLGQVDLQTGRLDFCNAGHNPPVLGGGESKGEFLQMEPNAPIGLWPGLEYVGEHIDSISHRPLFIYTDGLNEAENDRQQQFGDDRMLDLLRSLQFSTARHVIEVLSHEVQKHRAGAEPNDDLTMMCLNVT